MQIYDLSETIVNTGPPTSASAKRQQSLLAGRSSSAFAVSSLAALASSGNGKITRRPMQLKKDPDGNGKYISGLNEIRVQSHSVRSRILPARYHQQHEEVY